MKEDIRLWLRQAEDDLKAAEKNLGIEVYYMASFLAQQCAEKALKALYIKKFKELLRVHDLVYLAKKVEAPESVSEDCRFLSKVYIESRYPDEQYPPSELFKKKDAEKAISYANGVLKWVKTEI